MSLSIFKSTDAPIAAGGLSDATSEHKGQEYLHNRAAKQPVPPLQAKQASKPIVSLELWAAARHLNAAGSNLANMLAFLETQEAELSATAKRLERLGALKLRSQRPSSYASDASAGEMEFTVLQSEMVITLGKSLHGTALFSPDPITVAMSEDTSIASMVEFQGVDLLGVSGGPEGASHMAVFLSAPRLSSLPFESIDALQGAVVRFRMRNYENRQRVCQLMELLIHNGESADRLSDPAVAGDNTHTASRGVLGLSGGPSLMQTRRSQQVILNLIV